MGTPETRSPSFEGIEIHRPCTHNIIHGADEATCTDFSGQRHLAQKCAAKNCTSPWRLCWACKFLEPAFIPNVSADPESGLCAWHKEHKSGTPRPDAISIANRVSLSRISIGSVVKPRSNPMRSHISAAQKIEILRVARKTIAKEICRVGELAEAAFKEATRQELSLSKLSILSFISNEMGDRLRTDLKVAAKKRSCA